MKPRADAKQVFTVDFLNRTGVAYLAGHVDWSYKYRGQDVRVQADRIVIHVTFQGRPAAGRGREDARKDTRKREDDRLAIEDFRFYAEGNVRVEVPSRHTFIEADSIYYEHSSGRAVARGVRLKTSFQNASGLRNVFEQESFRPGPYPRENDEDSFGRSPLSLHADVLTMTGFERFRGEHIEVSTCDFAVPHFALSANTVDVYPVEDPLPRRGRPGSPARASGEAADRGPAGADLENLAGSEFIIDPEWTRLEAYGHDILPVPISYWDTRWQGNLPIRSLDFGSSNQFGYSAGVEWNLNYFLSLIPPSRFIPIDLAEDANSKLGFQTDEFSKRGFGYGPVGEYGKRPTRWDPWQLELAEWTYYGEAQYFHVDDHGPKDFSTGLPVPRDERYWGHAWHRQSVPYVGLFELEYSKLSDSAFLGEYFEEVAKEGKEQETLAYWQRNIGDNLALTALYQVRVNDFQSQVERLPEGKLFLFQEPLILPSASTMPSATSSQTGLETGLYTDFTLQGAYLNVLEDDALGVPPRAFPRFDIYNEWAYPFGFAPYIQARPFAFARFSEYGEVVDPAEGSEDRAAFGAGVSVSQEWSRIYRFEEGSFLRTFGLQSLKHLFVPRITYTNVFSNDLDSSELIQVDQTDLVDLQESVAFSIRNAFLTRTPLPPRPGLKPESKVPPLLGKRKELLEPGPFQTRSILDSEVSFALFPQSDRDNGGDVSSLLTFDNTVTVFPPVALRAWFEFDPNRDFRNDRSDVSVGWNAVPGKLALTVGDRYTRDFSNYAYALLNWRIAEKWNVQAYYARDVDDHRDAEYSFVLSRFFHRFVMSFEYQWDLLEDRNMSFRVNFMPLELFKPDRKGTRSTW